MPQSLIDRYQYDLPQSLLDVLPDPHLANPIALALHVIHYLLLAPLFPGHNDLGSVLRTGGREKGRWERFEDEHSTRGRSILGGWSVRPPSPPTGLCCQIDVCLLLIRCSRSS